MKRTFLFFSFSLLFIFPQSGYTQSFIRGDSNADGRLNLGDPITSLLGLFQGRPAQCHDAQDANDDGIWNLSDPVYTLYTLFLNGDLPSSPYPNCGLDPTEDALDCQTFEECKSASKGNVLLIIADDLGVDSLSGYQDEDIPLTPYIDQLTQDGVLFTNAWAYPICSPTRATLLTGRYGFRTGILTTVGGAGTSLNLNEQTLPEVLDAADSGYDHALMGKWHLGTNRNGGTLHPNLSGFNHFSGTLSGGIENYSDYPKIVNGENGTNDSYASTETVDDALDWLDGKTEPWFLWLAFNAPHTPIHLPPNGLHSQDHLPGTVADLNQRPREYYKAMIEAMDHEIGRLLENLSPEVLEKTTIIFIGDNGTPPRVLPEGRNRRHAKDNLYQGGIHVPLIISGHQVQSSNREEPALVQATDLFSTIINLCGIEEHSEFLQGLNIDSVSLVPYLNTEHSPPQRNWILSELEGSNFPERDGKAVRNDRYKLIAFSEGNDEFYDLIEDPLEDENLLDAPLSAAAESAYQALKNVLDNL